MHRPPRSRATTQYNFQRAYKACIPCRNRKVKCEVELEADPHRPCKRCRKMNLECRFSTKQPWSRKRGHEENRIADAANCQRQLGDCNGFPVLERGDRGATAATVIDNEESPTTTTTTTTTASGLDDGRCISTTVLQKQVASGIDALDILFDAATQVGSGMQAGARQSNAEEIAPHFDVCRGDNAVGIWEGCRFVKMGWFSAEEALIYMDWFFQNIVPVTTPILTDFFASHHTHYWLITQEPVLCCTILMISARYHTLPGPSGTSRGFYIHNRLWQHCQHLILRIMLGQEKLSKAKTRHLSSIEALLLLSEWYPLALHFPHEADGWDSDWMLTTLTMQDPPTSPRENPMQDRWREDVVEPTRRSDRMSWMLVSSALALAHELGIFDARHHNNATRGGNMISGPDVKIYLQDLELRRQRLPSLLFVITNQVASRIGCTSIMPKVSEQSSLDTLMIVDPEWAGFMFSWVNLTELTRQFRESYLVTSKSNHERIDFETLEQWKVQLAAWRNRHQNVDTFRYDNILLIEYQYLRVLGNSLGVQGILERVLSETDSQGMIDATFVSRARQLNMSRNEYEYIEEVIDGACAILARVVCLSDPRCLAMRVLSRVISSSIFLLKALALGVRKTKLQESLRLLDAAVAALLSNPLDDIHLVSRYATLLKVHVSRLRQTFTSSGFMECQNNRSDPVEPCGFDEQEQLSQAEGEWDPNIMDWTGRVDLGNWFSLPLNPMMAPFGSWDGAQADLGLDLDCLDLDFIWNLPP